jgi:hypothetical protein
LCTASIVHCIYCALQLLCTATIVHCIYCALQLLCTASIVHCIFCALHLLCTATIVHWNYCALELLCTVSIVHCNYFKTDISSKCWIRTPWKTPLKLLIPIWVKVLWQYVTSKLMEPGSLLLVAVSIYCTIVAFRWKNIVQLQSTTSRGPVSRTEIPASGWKWKSIYS